MNNVMVVIYDNFNELHIWFCDYQVNDYLKKKA